VSRPAIIVELRGRLGNQLFQYAVGLAAAVEHGCDLRFSLGANDFAVQGMEKLAELIGPRFQEATVWEQLRVGSIPYRATGRGRVNTRLHVEAGRAMRLLSKAGLRPRQVHVRSTSEFDPSVLSAEPPVLLRGWFQNEKYFEAHADRVIDGLLLPPSETLLPAGVQRPLVAVMLRRTDYRTFGESLSADYYKAALARVAAEVEIGTVVVHSDDPAFAGEMVEQLEPFGAVIDGTKIAPGAVAALAVTSACDHFVISASTFAWWAAWIGEQRAGRGNAVVVAPDRWFRSANSIVPERWLRVPADYET